MNSRFSHVLLVLGAFPLILDSTGFNGAWDLILLDVFALGALYLRPKPWIKLMLELRDQLDQSLGVLHGCCFQATN